MFAAQVVVVVVVGRITLLLRRGGQAGPAVVSQYTRNLGAATSPYHSNHLIQHVCGGCAGGGGRWTLVSPSQKVVESGEPFRKPRRSSTFPLSWRCPWPCMTSAQLCFPLIFCIHTKYSTAQIMAARLSIARAARQFTSAAAKKPSPFACQRWQQVPPQRLFSVSAACTHFPERPPCRDEELGVGID